MNNIFDIVKRSDSEFLKTELNNMSKWANLKHNKKDLQFLLRFNIANIEYLNKDGKWISNYVTSNNVLINLLQMSDNNFNTYRKTKSHKLNANKTNIENKDNTKIITFDIYSNKFVTISLTAWAITDFLTINEKNVLLISEILRDK